MLASSLKSLLFGLCIAFPLLPATALAEDGFDASGLLPQSKLSVDGSRIVDESGDTVVLRGVNIADPAKLLRQEQWHERLFEHLATHWRVNHIRLPVHPAAWRELGAKRYLGLLDQAVEWANRHDLYLILDWHVIGHLSSNTYQRDIYITTEAETREYWSIVSARYAGVNTIAVYELFNEPTLKGHEDDAEIFSEWRHQLTEIVDLIRQRDSETIPLVAGFNWAYDLTAFGAQPIEREGIAYASHPYPQKVRPTVKDDTSYFEAWQSDWGFMAERFPVMATELGWVAEGGHGAHIPVIDDGSYGPRIVKFMESRGISWTVWCFDPDWSPVMIEDWQYTPSEQGRFFKTQFRRLQPDREPAQVIFSE